MGFENVIKNYGTGLKNACEITINGRKIDWKSLELNNFEIDLSVDSASVCVLNFEGLIPFNKKIELAKEISLIQIGSKIEIKLGYRNSNKTNLTTVFVGYVFSVQIDLENSIQKLTINAMDSKMWLMANQRTEIKKDKKKYSDVIKNTLGIYSDKFKSINVSISGEPQLQRSICQRAESDYDFLCRIADITGSIFYISAGEVFFTNLSKNKSKNITIKPMVGVVNVKFESNILGIPKDVFVNRLDSETYDKMIKIGTSHIETIGNGKKGNEQTNNIASSNIVSILGSAESTSEHARFVAESQASRRHLNFVSCHVELPIMPNASLGTGITLLGFGDPIDNSYIIKNIKHLVTNEKIKTILSLSASCYSPIGSFGLPISIPSISSFF